MRHKVVIWGTNAADEKVLIALELQADANKVMLYTFPEDIAKDDFVNKMMKDWRAGKPVEFPEGHSALERELSVTDSLLPDNLKVDRPDVIQQAQSEWHFAVLSAKLHQAYKQELAEFKEKIAALGAYDGKVFDGLKSFWAKVQEQSRSRTLERDHADGLREGINALFEDLKSIRNRVQGELSQASQKIYDEFNAAVDAVEAKLEGSGNRVAGLFDELKALQQRYRDAKFTNEHRFKFFDRIDEAFKKVKERRFGGSSGDDASAVDRHTRRLSGLQDAINRMQYTIKQDEDELKFQQRKVNTTEGQLEAQIRMAKIKMVEERLTGKREKLADMLKTVNDIESQISRAKDGEQKRAERAAKQQRFDEAREAAKNEIASDIRSRKGGEKKEDSLFEAAGTVIGDVLMDALDTARAVASVMAEKAEEVMEEVAQKAEDMVEAITKKEEPAPEKAEAESSPLESTSADDNQDGIIEDVVHKGADAPPAAEETAPAPEAESGALESTSTGDNQDGIIEDVVHKGVEAPPAAEEIAEKPKRKSKKTDDAA